MSASLARMCSASAISPSTHTDAAPSPPPHPAAHLPEVRPSTCTAPAPPLASLSRTGDCDGDDTADGMGTSVKKQAVLKSPFPPAAAGSFPDLAATSPSR